MNKNGSGHPLNPDDFKIGEQTHISGRDIRIVGCDQYTREFCHLN